MIYMIYIWRAGTGDVEMRNIGDAVWILDAQKSFKLDVEDIFFQGKPMVNTPLIRPYFLGGGGSFGGGS